MSQHGAVEGSLKDLEVRRLYLLDQLMAKLDKVDSLQKDAKTLRKQLKDVTSAIDRVKSLSTTD